MSAKARITIPGPRADARSPRPKAAPAAPRGPFRPYTLLKWFGLDSYMADSLDILRM